MATKNIYLYKVTIRDESTGIEVPLDQYKALFQSIIAANSRNNALRLSTVDEPEVTILDIIENTDECLFARLNRKKLNNSMQKRNYRTYEISDVLQPDEIAQSGVESFTYCILGYSHGILSNSVVLSGKSNTGERQQKYDLFEEYFKYPISINEVIHENGRIRERGRAQLQMDYRNKMQNVYNEYKRLILLVSGR